MAARETLTLRPKNGVVDPDRGARLRKYCGDRLRSAKASREDYDGINEEVSRLTRPMKSRWLKQTTGRKTKKAYNVLQDGYGGQAAEVLKNGMHSGLSSSSRRWYRLVTRDPDLMRFHPVRMWLDLVQDELDKLFARSGFYAAAKTGYGENGLFGTEAGFMDTHAELGMVCHSMEFGEYWLFLDETNRPAGLLRQVPLTVRQAVERFVVSPWDGSSMDWTRVSAPIKDQWDRSQYETVHVFHHLVERNPEWDPVRLDAAGKKWRGVYWQANADVVVAGVAKVEGFEEQPFWGARWDASGAQEYGDAPGHYALSDLRDLQAQKKRKGDATDMAVLPPMLGPAGANIRLTPRAYNRLSAMERDAVKPAYQVDYRTIPVIREDVSEVKQAIGAYFYVDLFMAISRMQGVQPRNNEEIWSREEEKLQQLGPVIDRVNEEKLEISIDRAFGIALRQRRLPPPPPDLAGQELDVDFISILAQAQKALGLSGVERGVGFVGNLSGAFEDVTDNIDSDGIALEYLDRMGFPAVGIRDPRKRDQIRAERAQALAAQQARESAPAMQQGAQAAELLSRTDLRGRPLLETVLPDGA